MSCYFFKDKGFITLLAILVVGALGTLISTTLLIGGVVGAQNNLVQEQSERARLLADACAEEALLNLKILDTFVGEATINFVNGRCSYRIIDTGQELKEVGVSVEVEQVLHKAIIQAHVTSSSIDISSWQEVSD